MDLDLDNSRQEQEAITATGAMVALYGRAASRHLKVDTVSDCATDER